MKMNQSLIRWLALKEFFARWFCPGCTHVWDFPRLVILLTLAMSLFFFARGTQTSLLNNFAEVLLGNIHGGGIPVWINSNVADGGGQIDKESMRWLNKKKYKFYPYKEVDAGHLRLPSCATNDNRGEGSTACKLWTANSDKTPLFGGVAVFKDDPLWRLASSESINMMPDRLQIVLNKEQFERYFDYKAYFDELILRLPKKYRSKLPKNKKEFLSKNGIFWISIGRISEMRLLVPMEIKWVKSIPGSSRYSFLLPMEIYQSLLLSDNGAIEGYYPESVYEHYIQKLKIRHEGEGNIADLAELTYCLQQANSKDKMNGGVIGFQKKNKSPELTSWEVAYKLDPPKPQSWIKACLDESDIKNCSDPKQPASKYCFSQNGFEFVSQNKVSVKYKRTQEGFYTYQINGGIKDLSGFYQGFLYVEKASDLSSVIDALKSFRRSEDSQLKNSPFQFHEMYEDSLVRFNILQKILEVLGKYFLFFMGVFALFLILVKFWIIIDHRKSNYITYMAKGMRLRSIQILLSLQALIASVIALVLSIGIIKIFSYFMSSSADTELKKYNDILVNTHIDLLPIKFEEYVSIFAVLLLVSVAISWFFLWYTLKRR